MGTTSRWKGVHQTYYKSHLDIPNGCSGMPSLAERSPEADDPFFPRVTEASPKQPFLCDAPAIVCQTGSRLVRREGILLPSARPGCKGGPVWSGLRGRQSCRCLPRRAGVNRRPLPPSPMHASNTLTHFSHVVVQPIYTERLRV